METPTQSAELDQLAAALSAAQGSMPAAHKSGKNPHFKSRFASLEDVIKASAATLAEHGLSVSQFPVTHDGGVAVRTILMHSSGQWVAGTLGLPVETGRGQNAAQAVGSAISYARRYAYQAVLGIAAEDDDGNSSASPRDREQRTYPSDDALDQVGVDGSAITPAQHRAIWAKTKALGWDDESRARLLDKYGVNSATELTREQASEILDGLAAQGAPKKGRVKANATVERGES